MEYVQTFFMDDYMEPTLIIGYGNPDRQDDGAAWHTLLLLAQLLKYPLPLSPDEGFFSCDRNPNLLFSTQLTPELAEEVSQYQRICFIDAHTGSVPDDLHEEILKAEYQPSAFTHHMTPATILELSKTLYQAEPSAILVSIRGFQFGFSRSLSAQTQELADQAAIRIFDWLVSPSPDKG